MEPIQGETVTNLTHVPVIEYRTTVVHGVEKTSEALPTESKHLKQTIAKTAESLGIATDIYKTVKKLT